MNLMMKVLMDKSRTASTKMTSSLWNTLLKDSFSKLFHYSLLSLSQSLVFKLKEQHR